MDFGYWGDVLDLVNSGLFGLLLLYLLWGQWTFRRAYGHEYNRREYWRYGHGNALHERYRVVELLESAAKGCDHHGLTVEAQAFRDAASLVTQPHLIDTYAPRGTILPYWLADYVSEHRVTVALFGTSTEEKQ